MSSTSISVSMFYDQPPGTVVLSAEAVAELERAMETAMWQVMSNRAGTIPPEQRPTKVVIFLPVAYAEDGARFRLVLETTGNRAGYTRWFIP